MTEKVNNINHGDSRFLKLFFIVIFTSTLSITCETILCVTFGFLLQFLKNVLKNILSKIQGFDKCYIKIIRKFVNYIRCNFLMIYFC